MVAPDVYKKHQKTNQYTFGLRSTSIYIYTPSGYDKQFAMERSNMLLKTVDHLFRLGPSINLYHGYVTNNQRVDSYFSITRPPPWFTVQVKLSQRQLDQKLRFDEEVLRVSVTIFLAQKNRFLQQKW